MHIDDVKWGIVKWDSEGGAQPARGVAQEQWKA